MCLWLSASRRLLAVRSRLAGQLWLAAVASSRQPRRILSCLSVCYQLVRTRYHTAEVGK